MLRRSAELKLVALCNKQSGSSKNSDIIKENLGKLFVKKNDTRWNSMYNSMYRVDRFLQKQPTELDTVIGLLGLPLFRPIEVEYVHEYIKVFGSKFIFRSCDNCSFISFLVDYEGCG